MSKVLSSVSRLEDPYHNFNKQSGSNRSVRGALKKGISRTASKPVVKAFLTQEEDQFPAFEETTMHTRKSTAYDDLGETRKCFSDKKVKNILSRLDSTINKLNEAYKSTEMNLSRSSMSFFSRVSKGQTFMTDPNMDPTASIISKKSARLQDFSHMTMLNFSSPKINGKIQQVVQELDTNPMTMKICEHLWNQVNTGRDYYNLLRNELRGKVERLNHLKEQDELLDIMADNVDLEEKIEDLKGEIEKVNDEVEMSEMQTDVLNVMITQRKQDKILNFKRFQQTIQPFMKAQNQLIKDVDYVMTINQLLQNFMTEMHVIKEASALNKRFADRIRKEKELAEVKAARFDHNLELEAVYGKKKKQFIIKTKKEIEVNKQKEKEALEEAERNQLIYLLEAKEDYEVKFDMLSTVSKAYKDKEEYVIHLDNLKENNQELLTKVRETDEEINLKRTIDLPTLQAELNELKATRDSAAGYAEQTQLRKELFEKSRRNEETERFTTAKENLTTNLIRGVMTIFNKVSLVKDYLNLNKLDEIKLKQDNLGDILMFSGEVLEILTRNTTDHVQVRSQPLSLQDVSDDDQ